MARPSDLLSWLLLTWLVEWAVAAALLRRGDFWLGYYMLLINALTNPLANYFVLEHQANFWLVEGVVCVLEIVLCHFLLRISWFKACLLSVLANGVSGALSFAVIGDSLWW
jgi:hypothetical protein